MSSIELIQQAEQSLLQIFYEIDAQVKHNLRRILTSFRNHRVGTHHFSSVSGYGHGDLGREVLDRVFAEIVGAEAAAVRVQFVSGTHAIASCFYGVLRLNCRRALRPGSRRRRATAARACAAPS